MLRLVATGITPPSVAHSIPWGRSEARGSSGQDTRCGWERKAPRYQSMGKSRRCRCGTELERDQPGAGKRVPELTAGCWGTPCPSQCTGQRVQAAISKGFFKSQGWSKALSHQRYLALAVHETVALIKPKRSLN